jgi:ribosomal protein S18 acetylase RimI-like enzyme
MLGRAFVNDPLIRAIVAPADLSDAVRRMTALFCVIVRGHRGHGQPVIGVIDDGRVGGAAVIEQLGHPRGAAATVLHDLPLLPALLRVAGIPGLRRAISVLDTLTRNRPSEPHLYLNLLGVEPALQGRHFGVAMLDYLREQVALRRELAGVYLETATEANVAFYSRFGYRELTEIYPLGVRVWRMLQSRT